MSILNKITQGLGAGDEEEIQEVLLGLEIAAALGMTVLFREWQEVCQFSDANESKVVVDLLIAQDLASQNEEGWTFESSALVEKLNERARDNDRLRGHHAACARMLLSYYPKGSLGIAARCAAHMLEAGNAEEALQLLVEAEHEEFHRGDSDASEKILDQRKDLLDSLNLDADDPERAKNTWRRARLYYVRGDHQQAQSLVEDGLQVLRTSGWASECGMAALLQGRIFRAQGNLAGARESFHEATQHLALAGDEHGLAISRASQGYLDMYVGNHRQARELFAKAVAALELLGDDTMVARLSIFIAETWLVDGDIEQATQYAERGQEVARRIGHRLNEAEAISCMGEIARHQKQWTEARNLYESAAEICRDIGNRGLHICRLNIAMAEIGATNYAQARTVLEDLEVVFKKAFKSYLPLLYAGLMASSAGLADWLEVARYESLIRDSLQYGTPYHADVAALAEQTSQLADAGENELAQRNAILLASEQFEGLGNTEHAAELKAMLADI